MRRLLPLAVALGVGLCALLWGLAALEGIVIDERHQARDGIDDQQAVLAEYARRTLEQRLEAMLHERDADFDRALADPLADVEGLLLIQDGHQRLPWLPEAAPGVATPARELYDRLRRREAPPGLEPGSPWMRRVELYLELRDALDAGETEQIRHAMLAIIGHRASFVLDSTFDIPLTVATLDDFVAAQRPHPSLMLKLLRTGYDQGPGARVEPLQSTLLRRRGRFSAPDLRFLADRTIALSRLVGVPVDDFERAIDPPASTPLSLPSRVEAPMLTDGGRYYVVARSSSQVRGIAIDQPGLVASLQDQMRRRGLLEPDDRVELPASGPVSLSALPFEIHAPRFARARAEAEDRFWLKTSFVAAAALLVLVIVILALLLQRRRHRFVELKSDFVATVSHELRTPLASIRLMAETLQRRTRGLPAARDYPTRIVRDIDELTFLVENILSFNRLDKGRWQPRRSEVGLAGMLDQIVEDLPQYGFDDVRLETEGVDGAVLHGDRELLTLLLRNLIKNACTYNERRPVELRARARRERERFVLEISDNGVGIPAAEHGRIFEDFRRGAGTRARGSGLGLSICRKTMEAHGGKIRVVESSAEGTCFALEFPATMMRPSP